MTLVAPPSTVWREGGPVTGPQVVSSSDNVMDTEIHSSTASTPGPSDTTIVKDENGQDITCVVCGDKSSGKHYGQYTCEGRVQGCRVVGL